MFVFGVLIAGGAADDAIYQPLIGVMMIAVAVYMLHQEEKSVMDFRH
jgi:uncharacterized membrane protein YfcA